MKQNASAPRAPSAWLLSLPYWATVGSPPTHRPPRRLVVRRVRARLRVSSKRAAK
jgi:hypothetical protein